MNIRKLIPQDAQQYRSLRLLSLQTDPNAFFLRHEKAVQYPSSFFLEEMKCNLGSIFGFYGAFEDEKLIGMVSLQKKSEGIGQIYTFYVHPSHQKKGVGTLLLRHVIQLATKSGLSTLQLGVIQGNSAIHLYEELGFELVNRNSGSLKNDAGIFDELVYQRKLENF